MAQSFTKHIHRPGTILTTVFTAQMKHRASAEILPLGTTDWAQAFCCGGGLCPVGCSATPLPSAHEMPGDPIRSCDNSKCSKTLPHVPCVCECVSVKPPWLRTTVLNVQDSSIETLVQATCRVVICVLTLAFLIWEMEVI